MKHFSKIFFCALLVSHVIAQEPTTPLPSIDTPKDINQTSEGYEGYGIAQIRERQRLIKEKSGRYFGVGLGGFQIKKNYQGTFIQSYPAALLLKGGVQTFFNKNIGIRGFFAFDVATGLVNYALTKDPSDSFYAMLSLGIDLIGEFPLGNSYKHFLGVFAGVGGGATIYTDNQNFSLFKKAIYAGGVMIEGGVSLDIFIKHRIEIGLKVLPTAKTLLNNREFETSIMPYVMYNYQF
ncbi:hypothetical protein BKH46_03010 [Helicobacter sp. 12S02634-8]|uniref:outer membrane beta-barrel protein n=1 Tax=Helicobacter sp. 12S02634-8 TaxID=1476199 RepID=UPI000BA53D72|nr:outer membrane beta-barrel protein [Helicobacter sp. 12S02634-8]PAF47816.1 hypothetical protein BKH46_03010 [Helicobacter sp. 12S02634-8]